jgi:hypothetical protein
MTDSAVRSPMLLRLQRKTRDPTFLNGFGRSESGETLQSGHNTVIQAGIKFYW